MKETVREKANGVLEISTPLSLEEQEELKKAMRKCGKVQNVPDCLVWDLQVVPAPPFEEIVTVIEGEIIAQGGIIGFIDKRGYKMSKTSRNTRRGFRKTFREIKKEVIADWCEFINHQKLSRRIKLAFLVIGGKITYEKIDDI